MAELDLVLRAVDATRRGLSSAQRNIDRTADRTSRFAGIAKSAGLAVAGIGVAAVGIGTKLVGDFLERGSELRDFSRTAGVAAEELQLLGLIAERSGGSAEDVTDAFRELQLRLAEAAALGSGPAVDALGLLGVSLDDLSGLEAADQFALLRDRISAVEDPAQRLFLAEELLGGSSERLQAVLAPTAAEFANLRGEVEATGGIMSDDAVAAAGEMQDRLQELKQQGLEVVQQAIVAILPHILTFVEWLRDHAIPAIRSVARWLGDNLGPVVDFVRERWRLLLGIFAPVVLGIIELVRHWGTVRAALQRVWEWLDSYVMPVLRTLYRVIETYVVVQFRAWQTVIGAVIGVARTLWGLLDGPLLAAARGIARFVRSTFVASFRSAKRTIDAVVGAIRSVISLAQRAVDAVKSIPNPVSAIGDAAGSVGGFFRSVIPGLAAGGIVRRPTLAVVGEAGPEAVVPLADWDRRGRRSAGPPMSLRVVLQLDNAVLGEAVIDHVNLGLRSGQVSARAEFA